MIESLKNKQMFRQMKEDAKLARTKLNTTFCSNVTVRREFLYQVELIEAGFKNKENKQKLLVLFASKDLKQ